MFYNLHYATLNKDLKKAIYDRTISPDDLKRIYEQLKQNSEKKMKRLNIIMVCLILLCVLMIVPVFMNSNDTGFVKFMLLLLVPVIIVIYVISYFALVGGVKMQFNNAVKSSYPELANDIKL